MTLRQLRALAEQATPGPWKIKEIPGGTFIVSSKLTKVYSTPPTEGNKIIGPCIGSDAEFIAAANPQTILRLIDRIENLRETLSRYADSNFDPGADEAREAIRQDDASDSEE